MGNRVGEETRATVGADGVDPPSGALSGHPQVRRSEAAVEAARLRYELGRLRDRRTVRAALAVTGLRRYGLAEGLRTLRKGPPRWDVPGPTEVPDHPRYPHLRAGNLGGEPIVAGVLPTVRLTPTDLSPISRERIDLLLVDDVAGWDEPTLDALVAEAMEVGARVVAVGAAAIEVLGTRAHLRVRIEGEPPPRGASHDRTIEIAPAIDPRVTAPVGRDPRAIAAGHLPLLGLLEEAAAGAVPIAVEDPRRRRVLGPLADELLVPDAAAVPALLAALDSSPDRRDALSVQVRRHVLTEHSRAARTDRLLRELDLEAPPRREVGIALATRRPELVPAVVEDLARQVGVDLELVVAVHGDGPLPDRLAVAPRSVLRIPAHRPLGDVLNATLDEIHAPSIAKVDDDDRYGRHHLSDLLLALEYSGAEAVGKRRHAILSPGSGSLVVPPGPVEERWEDHLPGATMLIRGEVLRTLRWRRVPNAVDTELVRAIHLAGGACYSTHRFGFVRVRHGDHTYGGAGFGGQPLAMDRLQSYLDT
jgi:hypothetical protein